MRSAVPPSLVLAVVALASLPPKASAQPAAAAAESAVGRPFVLLAERGDATSWRVHPTAAGTITAEASWGGGRSLALILNGPGQVGSYARQDGASPLRLRFEVTPELLRLDGEWRLSIVNFSGLPARGQVQVRWPGGDEGGVARTGDDRTAVLSTVEERTAIRPRPPLETRVRRDPATARPASGNSATSTPSALEPPTPPAESRRSILPDGRVRIDHADGSARIFNLGCGWVDIHPDGSQTGAYCNQAQGAGLPQPPAGDAAFSGFLEDHDERLLAQIRFLVDGDAQAVDNYLAMESSTTSTVVERIDLRRTYVDRLLGIGF